MKRKLLCFAILIAMTVLAWAQTADLKVPNGGEKWQLNSKQKIIWTYSGSAKVKLMLIHKGGAKEGPIKTGLQLAAGSFEWTVGALEGGGTVPVGKDYLVRILKTDNTPLAISQDTFTITDSLLYTNFQIQPSVNYPNMFMNKEMKVTSPVKNDKWLLGGTYKITWDKGGSGDTKVGISLYSQGKLAYPIPGFFANTGSKTWTIPGSITIGNYVIKVFTIGDKFQAESGSFYIGRPHVPVKIDNRWSMRNEVSTKIGCGPGKRGTQPEASPAPGEILVGFDNFYDSGYCWESVCHVYVGFVSFDLSELKGGVTKARLEMVRTTSVHRHGSAADNSSQCMGTVQVLDGPWSVDAHGYGHAPSHYYHQLPNGAASDGIVNYDGTKNMTIDITDVVKKWLSGQQANFGLMFIGRGNYNFDNEACYSTFGQIHLSVE
jgi:hypothetical protein